MNFTEGFGKKWIERILGKVDKDQGVANAGKVLGIGNDGQVVPVAQSGGGSSITVDSALNVESTNPVENGVITSALNNKVDALQSKKGYLLATDANTGVVKTVNRGSSSLSGTLSFFDGTTTYNNKTYKSAYVTLSSSSGMCVSSLDKLEDVDTKEKFVVDDAKAIAFNATLLPEGTVIAAPQIYGSGGSYYIYVEEGFYNSHPHLKYQISFFYIDR